MNRVGKQAQETVLSVDTQIMVGDHVAATFIDNFHSLSQWQQAFL